MVVRKASGLLDVYLNGELAQLDADSGTPVAGSTNIIIGNNNVDISTTDGQLPEVIILEGLLTPSEISNYYTATKAKYGK